MPLCGADVLYGGDATKKPKGKINEMCDAHVDVAERALRVAHCLYTHCACVFMCALCALVSPNQTVAVSSLFSLVYVRRARIVVVSVVVPSGSSSLFFFFSIKRKKDYPDRWITWLVGR